ncbi:MAG TPA: aromatic ring-hydroxylating dioxygenase subunit alpha [Thermoplasmata archaeon]|jgi:Rieske 2Fe-2S family protein
MPELELIQRRRAEPGAEHMRAATLPPSVYFGEEVYRQEIERLFLRSWLNIGHVDMLPEAGDFFTREIGNESLLFIRGTDGEIRGFYNVCRHRGTRLVEEKEGKKLRSIVCPYHSWAYSPDGKLVGAPHTDGLEAFDKSDFRLHPVKVGLWGGFIWANLDPRAKPFDKEFREFFGKFQHIDFSSLKLGAMRVYETNSNWKILAENYSECYHCAPVHPGLNRVTYYMNGENDAWMARGARRRNFSGGWMDFSGDYTSMTVTGYTKRPPLRGTKPEDVRRIHYYVVFPGLFFSLHPDYLMIHRDWPKDPTHSTIECEWYFDKDVMARDDFDPSDAVDMWDEINRQDWAICERTQRGVMSRAWKSGRFSEQEPMVYDLDKYYAEQMRFAKPRFVSKASKRKAK